MDLESLPFESGSLEVVICSDVLEHVEDDARAISEIQRVLRPGRGVAFVHVPIVASETVEYGFPVAVDHGHRRAYGPDVARRLMSAGLEVREYGARQLTKEARRRSGILPADRVFLVSTPRADVVSMLVP